MIGHKKRSKFMSGCMSIEVGRQRGFLDEDLLRKSIKERSYWQQINIGEFYMRDGRAE